MAGTPHAGETEDMPANELPRHPVQATVYPVGSRWVVTLERPFEHSAAEIWEAVTNRDDVPRWAPFSPDRNLDVTGAVQLAEAGASGGGAVQPGKVVTAATQRMLTLTWGPDDIDIELAPTSTETIVRLSHTFDDRSSAPSFAAGWHLCLSALDAVLSEGDAPRVTGDAAHEHGWDELFEAYTELLGEE